MKNRPWLPVGLALLALALFVLAQSLYTVGEADQVILTQFGKPVGQTVSTPGLHLKVPFVQRLHRFERRFMEWDGERNQLPTRDKRFIFVDTYARWRISDALKFFQRLRDERGAQSRLDDILDGEARNVIARHDLIEVVRTSSRDFAVDDEEGGLSSDAANAPNQGEGHDFKVKAGRQALAAEVLKAAQSRTDDLGIEILDFQFKRINYVAAVQAEVYTRMISERKRIAEQFRSEGVGEAARIHGEKERELARITSEAYKTAEQIRGEADATAARTYAQAYNVDPELYGFLKSMETYRQTVDEGTILLLGTDSEALRYLEDSTP
jgi:membrane protease subunit HflC